MLSNSQTYPTWNAVVLRMSVKSTSRAARLKNYLRMLMQQQSLILSKKSTFIILFSGYCYVSILH